MRRLYLSTVIILTFLSNIAATDYSGAFYVSGSSSLFYPVTFYDGMWMQNQPTRLYLSRHNVHTDETWYGSLAASFEFHTTMWGNGSNYINADIHQFSHDNGVVPFIAGWEDATKNNSAQRIVIWLKGHTTYYYHCNTDPLIAVYDGVSNTLPYSETGYSANTKSTIDSYVESFGCTEPNHLRIGAVGESGNTNVPTDSLTTQLNIDFTGYRDAVPDQIGARISALRFNKHQDGSAMVQKTGLAFYTNKSGMNSGDTDLEERMRISPNGYVGIGTTTPDSKLTVNGTIHAKEVLVDLNGALADYVFEPTYNLKPLSEVQEYINQNKHLPDTPSAADVAEKGISVGEMQNLLLQKIEELTLYTIQQQREIEELKRQLQSIR